MSVSPLLRLLVQRELELRELRLAEERRAQRVEGLPSRKSRVASSFAFPSMWWRRRFSFSVEATSATKIE